MKLFNFSKNAETGSSISTGVTMSASDLSKHQVSLDKVIVDLSKNSVDLTKLVSRVGLAVDYSGSMYGLFEDGAVQRTLTRLFPIGLKFDDNGEMESWLFSDDYRRLPAVTEKNYDTYVKKVMQRSHLHMSGTQYSPVLEDILDYYSKESPSQNSAFVMFITDGEPSDRQRTDSVIRKISEHNLFVQFVGIGSSSFSYLKALDDLPGRKCDNTGFISVRDMDKLSDEELYTELLRQYRDWLHNKRFKEFCKE